MYMDLETVNEASDEEYGSRICRRPSKNFIIVSGTCHLRKSYTKGLLQN